MVFRNILKELLKLTIAGPFLVTTLNISANETIDSQQEIKKDKNEILQSDNIEIPTIDPQNEDVSGEDNSQTSEKQPTAEEQKTTANQSALLTDEYYLTTDINDDDDSDENGDDNDMNNSQQELT